MTRLIVVLCVACGLFATPVQADDKTGSQVDLALILAVDSSGSVNPERWQLQKDGYADAFRSLEVVGAIKKGLIGAIEVTMVHWSGEHEQQMVTQWHRINDAESSMRFANAIAESGRAFKGMTAIGYAIDFCVRLLQPKVRTALRRIIDVSGDESGSGARLAQDARDDAVRQGIVINGLPILSYDTGVEEYYRRRVRGGPGSFIVVANGYHDFAAAVRRKLVLEVASSAIPK